MIVKSGLFLHSSLVSLHVKFLLSFVTTSQIQNKIKQKTKKKGSNQIRVAL